MRGHRRLSRCSVVSPSSTVERPRCGSSTPSGSSTPRPGPGSRRSRSTPTPSAPRRSSARRTSPTRSGPASARPYLDHAVLERALVETGADAAWVGWGFVAEDPAFAELCEKIGVTFVGPSAEAMRKLGDKIGVEADRRGGRRPGRAVEPRRGRRPWTPRCAAGEEIGYPLMLKATAGGGGRGIRVVASDEDLTDAYERTSQEAPRAFGSGVVFLERLVTGARHVEVQVIADGQGTAWALGVRDCSVQRRNQKVIEESASPVLAPEQAAELKASAERLALAVGYRGAGTVEFLYHPGEQLFAFLEVNTRLQVEHPITEITTDIDLVKAAAARGRAAAASRARQPVEAGHAVEARLNAEDPDRDFAPVARPHRPAGAARRPRHPGRHRRQRGRHHPGRLRLDDREDHRLRPRPRRGAGPAAPGDGRDHGDHRGRRDQQELRARPARPARGDRRQRRHRLDRPGPRRGPPGQPPALRRSPWPRPRSRRTRTRSRSSGSGCCPPRTAAARRCSTRAAGRSTSSCAASATG